MHEDDEILEGCNCMNCRMTRIEEQINNIQATLKKIQKSLKK